jgi:hypothetical protein
MQNLLPPKGINIEHRVLPVSPSFFPSPSFLFFFPPSLPFLLHITSEQATLLFRALVSSRDQEESWVPPPRFLGFLLGPGVCDSIIGTFVYLVLRQLYNHTHAHDEVKFHVVGGGGLRQGLSVQSRLASNFWSYLSSAGIRGVYHHAWLKFHLWTTYSMARIYVSLLCCS